MIRIDPLSPSCKPFSWAGAVRSLPVVAVISTAIGLVTAVMMGDSYQDVLGDFLVSNAVGLCAWSGSVLIRYFSGGRVGILTASLMAALPALLVGAWVMTMLGVPGLGWIMNPIHQWRPLASSVLLTFAAVAFAMRNRAATEYRAELEVQRRQLAEARQGETLAQLALLQAQIEPHFLFNTLANVQSMIEREPRTAARMLDHLNRYLRASLGRTRAASSTCGGELQLIDALLAIAEIRLGGRLRYRVEMADELRRLQLPPLLLQPLVENALKHGIEPAVGGGEIEVAGTVSDGVLVLAVRDTGIGFQEGAPPGVGLSNVRARLASLYGTAGQLILHRNEPRGTVAEIHVPLRLL